MAEKPHYEDFMKLMSEYGSLLDELLVIENRKINATGVNDISTVENCMRQEEAAMLKMRGFDQRREKLLAEMGRPNGTFADVVAEAAGNASADECSALRNLHTDMKQKTERLKELTASAHNMMESKLLSMEAAAAAKGSTGINGSGGYAQDGTRMTREGGTILKNTSV